MHGQDPNTHSRWGLDQGRRRGQGPQDSSPCLWAWAPSTRVVALGFWALTGRQTLCARG